MKVFSHLQEHKSFVFILFLQFTSNLMQSNDMHSFDFMHLIGFEQWGEMVNSKGIVGWRAEFASFSSYLCSEVPHLQGRSRWISRYPVWRSQRIWKRGRGTSQVKASTGAWERARQGQRILLSTVAGDKGLLACLSSFLFQAEPKGLNEKLGLGNFYLSWFPGSWMPEDHKCLYSENQGSHRSSLLDISSTT